VLPCVRLGLGRCCGLAEVSIPAGKNDRGSSESKFTDVPWQVFLFSCSTQYDYMNEKY
jgi:hypothetical protein